MKHKIEAAIRETLVIENKQSIWRAVDKILLIFEQEQALRQANVSGALPPDDATINTAAIEHECKHGNSFTMTMTAADDFKMGAIWAIRKMLSDGNDR